MSYKSHDMTCGNAKNSTQSERVFTHAKSPNLRLPTTVMLLKYIFQTCRETLPLEPTLERQNEPCGKRNDFRDHLPQPTSDPNSKLVLKNRVLFCSTYMRVNNTWDQQTDMVNSFDHTNKHKIQPNRIAPTR